MITIFNPDINKRIKHTAKIKKTNHTHSTHKSVEEQTSGAIID